METSDLNVEQQKKYDEMKKKYLQNSKPPTDKQNLPQSHSGIITSLENQIKEKRATLQELNSKNLLSDLKDKKQHLDDNVISKKQNIQELRSNLQKLQKELIQSAQELRSETEQKTNELYTINDELSELITEENQLVEKIQEAQKLRASQEKELEGLRLERLNIVNKNKDTQKIQEEILQHRTRLEQITSDRSMLELEIKSQMNLLEEERQKEIDIISKITKQLKN